MPSGLRPSGTALPSGFFFASDEKKPRCRGYIVVYSPPKIIYTLQIFHLQTIYTVYSNYHLKSTYSKSYIAFIWGLYNSVYMPAAAGIYMYICPPRRAFYIYWLPWHIFPAMAGIIFEILFSKFSRFFGKKMRFLTEKVVYLLYIWGLVGLYTTIQPPRPRLFFVLGNKIPSGRAVPLGFFLPRTKNNLGLGAISLYIALRDPIYTLHIWV